MKAVLVVSRGIGAADATSTSPLLIQLRRGIEDLDGRHGMLDAVNDALIWIAAIGGVLATVGAWTGPLRARWNMQAEGLRTGRAQRENLLHRWRYAQVWEWQRNQPEGSARADAARWFGEWTGAVGPRRGGAPRPTGAWPTQCKR